MLRLQQSNLACSSYNLGKSVANSNVGARARVFERSIGPKRLVGWSRYVPLMQITRLIDDCDAFHRATRCCSFLSDRPLSRASSILARNSRNDASQLRGWTQKVF